MHGFPLSLPLELEIGLGVEKVAVLPGQLLESFIALHDVRGPLEVFGVIGHEEEFAAGDEDLADGIEKRRLEEPAAVMPGLGPGVRAEQVETGNGGGRKEPLDGVAAFQAEQADVFQASTAGFLADFADPAEEAFDAEEIAIRELPGHGEEERAIAAAEIDLQRARAGEDFVFFHPTEVVGRHELAGFGATGGRLHFGKSIHGRGF